MSKYRFVQLDEVDGEKKTRVYYTEKFSSGLFGFFSNWTLIPKSVSRKREVAYGTYKAITGL